MAQTIKLTSTYNGYRPGTILTVPDAVATALLAGGIGATTDLTGGFYPPAAAPQPNNIMSVKVEVNPAGTVLGLLDAAGKPLATPGIAQTVRNSRLPTFSKAMAELAAGVSTTGVNVGIIGDSLSVGLYANTTAQPGAAPYSFAALLAGMSGGTDNAFFGGVQLGAFPIVDFLGSDSRVTQSAGAPWQVARLGAKVLGTSFDHMGEAGPASLTFSPAAPWDTLDVYYVSNTNYGTVAVSGAVTGTITSTAALGINSQTFTKAQGVGSITLTPTGENHIAGLNFYSKSSPTLNFLKLGAGGSTTANAVDNTANYKSLPALQKLMATSKVPLWLIQLGTNDMLTAVAVATYTTNMQTLITTLKRSPTNTTGGDVVLVMPPPIPFGSVTEAIQMQYRDALYDLAATNGLLVVDNYIDLVSPAYGAAKGWYSQNQALHLNASGYTELATNLYKSLISFR